MEPACTPPVCDILCAYSPGGRRWRSSTRGYKLRSLPGSGCKLRDRDVCSIPCHRTPILQAGGFSACSRWSCEAIPPDDESNETGTPDGVQAIDGMPSTHTNLLYHIIFATKDREPWIAAEWRARLHEYMGGAVRGLGGVPQGVGGVADHVHLLVGLKPTHCLSDFMRELKKNSSVWISETILLRHSVGRKDMPLSR